MTLHRERPAVQGNDASQLVCFFFLFVVVSGLKDAFQFLDADILRLQLSVSSSRSPLVDCLGGVRQAKMEDQFFVFLFLVIVVVVDREKELLHRSSSHPSIRPSCCTISREKERPVQPMEE